MGPPSGRTGLSRSLIVVADDYGLTSATSDAIVAAHRAGIVTAVSVLGNGPATISQLDRLTDAPDLAVGVHVALVGEDPPCSAATEIPTLVDRRGRFRTSWRRLLPALAAGRIDPADVRRELDAQVAVVASTGLRLTHLNLHQHLQLWPSIHPAVIQAAADHGIGYVRTPGSGATGPRGAGVRRLAHGLRRALAAAGIDTADGFVGLDEAGALDGPRLRRAIGAAEGGVVEVNLHPGPAEDPDRFRYRWGYRWSDELTGLTDPATRASVAAAGFRLCRPADLRDPGADGR